MLFKSKLTRIKADKTNPEKPKQFYVKVKNAAKLGEVEQICF